MACHVASGNLNHWQFLGCLQIISLEINIMASQQQHTPIVHINHESESFGKKMKNRHVISLLGTIDNDRHSVLMNGHFGMQFTLLWLVNYLVIPVFNLICFCHVLEHQSVEQLITCNCWWYCKTVYWITLHMRCVHHEGRSIEVFRHVESLFLGCI